MNDLRLKVSQHIFPVLLIVAGLVLLFSGTQQNWMFKLGGAVIALTGVISALNIAGFISKGVGLVIMVVMILGSAAMGYLDYVSIDSEIQYIKKKDMIASEVIQRLKDIRTAQVAYNEANGKYTSHWDTLQHFVMSGKVPIIQAYGERPDTLTEVQALELGLIVRDTVYESVLEREFLNPNSQRQRNYPLRIDSLRYVPHSGRTVFELDAGFITDASGRRSAVFMARDPKPFAGDALQVGDMERVSISGNWVE